MLPWHQHRSGFFTESRIMVPKPLYMCHPPDDLLLLVRLFIFFVFLLVLSLVHPCWLLHAPGLEIGLTAGTLTCATLSLHVIEFNL